MLDNSKSEISKNAIYLLLLYILMENEYYLRF